MTYQRFHAAFVGVVAALVDSIVVAELAGYWLHRLLMFNYLHDRVHPENFWMTRVPFESLVPERAQAPRHSSSRRE